jgi:DNA helicase-2/ATP-dependent DNA helicase PcrA
VRAGFQTREFEERFITMGLRYRVIGGPRFYERQEIRDALAYLRLVNQPDDGLAFERIINVPKRGLGDATLKQINAAARALNVSLPEAARRIIETDELKPAPRRTLTQLMRDLERWRALVETTAHTELAQIVLEESGYTDMWRNDKSIEAPGRLDNLKELIPAMEEFDSLGGFLEHVSLVMENAAAGDGEMITIMTLHGAKGLEFDVVFLPGWEEGLFPSQRSLDENGMKGLEEERRLAYVGLTRAKKRAYISFAANRQIHGMWQNALPSRFIAELPKAHLEREENEIFRPSERYVGQPSGWGRQPPRDNYRSRGDTLIDLRAEPVAQTGTGRYPSGARIFHQKFGYGKVLHSEGDKLEIAFEKAGVKKVMAGFVVPAEQAG